MEGEFKYLTENWILQGEVWNFIKVWISVYISLFYCYFVSKIVPKGTKRLFSILPVVSLFFILPLYLHTMHLGITSAFFISWLTNFKLLLLAFDRGHLSDPSISLPRFVAVACLPIKIRQQIPSPAAAENGHSKQNLPPPRNSSSILNYAVKGVLLASMIKIYDYSDRIPHSIIRFMYGFHIYFALEIILGIVAALARGLLGVELEPTFKEPLLSSSLQDFWGRRWNIMVNRILRPSVYDPVLSLSSKLLSREWAPLPAVFGTFVVSGLMHELIFYYMGRLKPTWKITWFFLLHGFCLVLEVAVKKALKGRFQLPRPVATALVVLFIMTTGIWLFVPEMLRHHADVRAFEEYAALGAFLKDLGKALTLMPTPNTTTVH